MRIAKYEQSLFYADTELGNATGIPEHGRCYQSLRHYTVRWRVQEDKVQVTLLESLPTEMKTSILYRMCDTASLRSLVLASPAFHAV